MFNLSSDQFYSVRILETCTLSFYPEAIVRFSQGKNRGSQLLIGFLAAIPAFLVSAPAAAMLSLHIAQKASSAGAPAALGNLGTDLVIAAVLGICSLGLCGFLALLAAQLHPKSTRVRGLPALQSREF